MQIEAKYCNIIFAMLSATHLHKLLLTRDLPNLRYLKVFDILIKIE